MSGINTTIDMRGDTGKMVFARIIAGLDLLKLGEVMTLISDEKPRWVKSQLQMKRRSQFGWNSQFNETTNAWMTKVEKLR